MCILQSQLAEEITFETLKKAIGEVHCGLHHLWLIQLTGSLIWCTDVLIGQGFVLKNIKIGRGA